MYYTYVIYLCIQRGPVWLWSCGSWIYNYICHQCLSPLKLWVRIPLKVRCIYVIYLCIQTQRGSFWLWSCGNWIYNYICYQCLIITTKVVSSNPAQGEVYLIQFYLTKIVSDLQQVCGFLQVLRFPTQIKLTATI